MLGGGPQQERDGQRASSSSASASAPLDRATEKQVYEGEVVRLRRENLSYRDQLKRSLVELRSYQLKFPSAHVTYDDSELENLPPWATAPDIVSPIMRAYDERVRELEGVVSQQSGQLDAFQHKLESILAENDTLRNIQLDQLKNSTGAGGRGGFGAFNPMDSVKAETLIELNERIDILMAENAVMVEQKAALSTELDNYQDELTSRTDEMTTVTEKLSFASSELYTVSERCNIAEKNLEDASGKIISYSNQIGKLESDREDLQEQLATLKQKNVTQEASIRDLRQNMKALVSQTDDDSTTCLRRTKGAEDRVRELHSLLEKKTQELEKTQESLRKLRIEYQSTRQDAEGMLQVMGGLERQLSEYASRENEVDRTLRESRDGTEQAKIERDQAKAKEAQCHVEITRLLAERKTTAQGRQALIDQEVERARERMFVQLRATEADLDEIVKSHAISKAQAEKSHRDARAATERVERFERMREEEKAILTRSIRDLEEKLSTFSVEKEEESRRRVEVQEQNKDLRLTIDHLRSDADDQRVKFTVRLNKLENELSSLRASLRDAQREALDAARTLNRKSKELEDSQADFESQMTAAEKRRLEESSLHRRRASEVEIEHKELTLAVAGEERRSQMLVEQLTQKTSATITRLEAEQLDARQQLQRVNQKVREFEALLKEEEQQKSNLVELYDEAKAINSQLQEELAESQGAVSDLTSQLINASEAREEALNRRGERDSSKDAYDEDEGGEIETDSF